MSKSNYAENKYLLHVFNNEAIADIGDANGLPASATAGNLYLHAHTADPGEDGDSDTNEAAYTGYAPVAVARSSAGWTVSGNQVNLAEAKYWGQCSANPGNPITHWSVCDGSAANSNILYSGTVTPNITMQVGTNPGLGTDTNITED